MLSGVLLQEEGSSREQLHGLTLSLHAKMDKIINILENQQKKEVLACLSPSQKPRVKTVV